MGILKHFETYKVSKEMGERERREEDQESIELINLAKSSGVVKSYTLGDLRKRNEERKRGN